MTRRLIVGLALLALLVTTCTCGEPEEPDASPCGAPPCGDPSGGDPLPGDSAAGDPGAGDCPRQPAAADRTRYVVAARHNDFANLQRTFEVYALSDTGLLSFTGYTFQLGGRATYGDILFTPDGEIGVVALDNDTNGDNQGAIGVFRLDAGGVPTVIHEAYSASAFASAVVMGPAGRTVYVIERDAQEMGGGVYAVSIGCDGTLVDEGLVMQTNHLGGMHLDPHDPSRAVLVDKELDPPVTGYDARLFAWPPLDPALGRADIWTDAGYIVADTTLTWDARYLLVADASPFNGLPDRIGVAEVLNDGLLFTQSLDTHFQEPTVVFPSPFNNAVLVATAGGGAQDSIHWLTYDATDSVSPFSFGGEVAYQGVGPQLPGTGAMIRRGGLAGRVLLTELSSIRQLQFNANGTVADVGLFDTGDGVEYMVGAIGVQP